MAEGDGAAGNARRRAALDDEAEESGAEAAGPAGDDEEEEEDPNDDGADLAGFIVQPGEEGADDGAAGGAGEDEEGSSSEDGDKEGEAPELLEEDIQVLREAGIDVSQLESQRREAAAAAAPPGAPPAGGGAPAAEPVNEDDLFGDMSDEDIDTFIVQEPGAKRRRRAEDADLDIDDEQLQEIVDIFGDTSVLRPIDEASQARAGEDAARPPELPLVMHQDSGAPDSQPSSALVAGTPLDADPDLKAKMYESPADFELERRDEPERWSQIYRADSALLDASGNRIWSEDEVDCEARWIFGQCFWDKLWDQVEGALVALREILDMLHGQQLEPIFIVTQFEARYNKLFYGDDLWRICELDQQHWGRIWAKYRKVRDWKDHVKVPAWMKERLDPKIFDQTDAETTVKDIYDWFCAMHPELEQGAEGKAKSATSMGRVLADARKQKFDVKLGIKESVEQMSLELFSITPEQFGLNVANGTQVAKPKVTDEKVREVLEAHRNEDFKTCESVLEAIVLMLSKLIAADPRVREYVRKRFQEMCAISTSPTEEGRRASKEAAFSFKRAYRAFHLVNRRISTLKPFSQDQYKDDELFLDVLDLQRKGLVNLEYSLIQRRTEQNAKEWEYQYVMLGHTREDLIKDRQRMSEHFNRMDKQGEHYTPGGDKDPTPAEIEKWTWCKEMRVRLEAALRSQDAYNRSRIAEQSDSKKQLAEALFVVTTLTFNFDRLSKNMTEDPILSHLMDLYCVVEQRSATEFFVVPGEWNTVRENVLLRVLRDELYPMLWAEIQGKLARAAEDVVCKACAQSLTQIVDVQPWKPDEDYRSEIDETMHVDEPEAIRLYGDNDEDATPAWRKEREQRKLGHCPVLVVVPEVGILKRNPDAVLGDPKDKCVVCLLNGGGEPIDMRTVFKRFHIIPKENDTRPEPPQDSFPALMKAKVQAHQDAFKALLVEHSPAAILIPVSEPDTTRMRTNIQRIVDDLHNRKKAFKVPPKVMLCDPSVARIVAYHPRCKEEGVYRDCQSEVQRIAISVGRFMQDPLAETCQLWHEQPEENGLFRLRLHRLQHAVPKGRLGQALAAPLIKAMANAGVHVNRIRSSPHLASVVAFLPGFGPRKLRLFKRCLRDPVTSRQAFATRIATALRGTRNVGDPMRSRVVANCLPFIKIAPDPRDNWNKDLTPGFDRTRLCEAHRPWLVTLCEAAVREMAGEEEAEDPAVPPPKDIIARAMRLFQGKEQSVHDVVGKLWDFDWEKSVGAALPPQCNAAKYLETLLQEVSAPYKDLRQPRGALEDSAIFHLAVNDTPDNLNLGCLIHAVVDVDMEYPERIIRPDGTQAGTEKRPSVRVIIVPSGIRGQFPKQYKIGQGQGYIPNCDRHFPQGEKILARLMMANASEERTPMMQLSVDRDADMVLKYFPIQDDDVASFVPLPNENWVKCSLGVAGAAEDDKLKRHKTKINRPRNVRHPNWFSIDHEESLAALDLYPIGNVIFRPSKRFDLILCMLKVRPTHGDQAPGMNPVDAEKCYRGFDVYEVGGGGSELSRMLEVDGLRYQDFDEIIAGHMEPIMDNLRKLQEHPKFGLGREQQVTELYDVVYAIRQFSKDEPRLLFYCFLLHPTHVGHGMLVWTFAGHTPRQEFIEVSPNGLSLWGQSFATPSELAAWFKLNFRSASTFREDWRKAWQKRVEAQEERRGLDAASGRKRAAPGYKSTATTTGGLQTPGGHGGLSTPGGYAAYGSESAAPTPSGLATPGNRTPMGYAGGTRTPMQAWR